MRRNRNDAGFSAVELLIVIGMIAVLTVVAMPSLLAFMRTYHIRGAVQEVRGTIQAARLKAVANNVHFGVLFIVVDNRSYQWAIEDRLEGAGAGQEKGKQIQAADLIGADWPGQVGPVAQLPGYVEFAADSSICGGFTPNSSGLRFNNLGFMCSPTAGSTTCPELGVGGNYIMHTEPAAGVEGGATVCLVDKHRGLHQSVHVSPSGRIETVR